MGMGMTIETIEKTLEEHPGTALSGEMQTDAPKSSQELNTFAKTLPPAPSPDTLMRALVMAASDPAFDVEKLRTLRELHKEAIEDQRRAAWNEAMARCQEEMAKIPIKANKKNSQTNSVYADISAINRVIKPIYTKHGFSVNFDTIAPRVDNHLTMRGVVSHNAGFERAYTSDYPLDVAGIRDGRNKTDIHAQGSTKTYARRYMLIEIFNLDVEGMDKDGNSPNDMVTEEQVAELKKIVKDNKMNEAEVLNYLKVENLSDIYAGKFQAAKTAILQRAKAAQQKK